ncbi:LptA/OstA family protein [Limimaricola pyoseonensis]|uniref:Lipopolysaccharide export system protein LptA n=1 Tax=Limimaricola pyoseonensis TaxID=521013 RepID=A0A1G7ETV9_9RHOB|nr:LptA/OstA family protein [Limimaricola pyoseonensis]SDE67089.1 lipopolysaccharide export system protein LptA [Limimaricola pyoseonensis]
MIRALAPALLALLPLQAAAQTSLSLGSLNADPDAPVEVTAESLSVDQASGAAVFEGEVLIVQGEMRIAAATVEVIYDDASGEISRLEAVGGVTFVTPTEAAESNAAVYDIASGMLTLTGEVLLTQSGTALSAQSMVVDLNAGTARLEGGVRTVFEPQGQSAR